jgi:signal transduction histidine kinase
VLRHADEAEARIPMPGLAGLDELVEQACQAGLPTRLAIQGAAHPLSPAVDLTAYRVVQESLTNALRYAGPASAEVTIAYDNDHVVIEVTDDGQGGDEPSHGAGLGLAGMQERVATVGGQVEVGRRIEGGFRVRASLPARL